MAFDFTQAVKDAVTRLLSYYNGNAYNSGSNPGGYDNDGHRINFVPTLRDLANVASAIAAAANLSSTSADVASSAAGTATERAGAAGLSSSAAATARDLAQGWATKAAGEVETGKGYSAFYWAQRAADLVQQATGGGILPSGQGPFTIGNLLIFDATNGRAAKDSGIAATNILKADDLLGAIKARGAVDQATARANLGIDDGDPQQAQVAALLFNSQNFV